MSTSESRSLCREGGISPGIEQAPDLAYLGNPKIIPRTESSAIRPIVVVLLGDAGCSPPRDGLFGVGSIDWASPRSCHGGIELYT
jgi:hypothetical protein